MLPLPAASTSAAGAIAAADIRCYAAAIVTPLSLLMPAPFSRHAPLLLPI